MWGTQLPVKLQHRFDGQDASYMVQNAELHWYGVEITAASLDITRTGKHSAAFGRPSVNRHIYLADFFSACGIFVAPIGGHYCSF